MAGISKSIGELLMSGWTMLADSCPKCQVPLMRDPKTHDRKCVGCMAVYAAGKPLDYVPPPVTTLSEEETLTTEKEGNINVKTDILAKQSSSNDTSDLLSEKMLQGWALLETCCPRCNTPLVRNKQKRRHCVTCDSWVLTEEEAMAMQNSAAAAAVSTAAANVPHMSLNLSKIQKQDSSDNRGPFRAENPPRVPSGGVDDELLVSLSSALTDKLWQAQRLLVSTPITETDVVRGVVGTISDCLQAMALVKRQAHNL